MNRTISVRACGPADRDAWNAFVAGCAGATSYHRWEWGDVIEGTMGLPRHYYAALRGEEILGVLPFVQQRLPLGGVYLTSLPFLNYAGIASVDPAAEAALIEATQGLVRRLGASYAELRTVSGHDLALPASLRKVRPVLALPADADTLMRSFPAKQRSAIRKPFKEGLRHEVGGLSLLGDFYAVMARRWRELGSPIYRRAFFQRIFEAFPGENDIIRVLVEDRTIGTGWLHTWRGTSEFLWSATRREDDRLRPGTLLYWAAMCTAIERGATLFDFGRSNVEKTGTHRFKLQFGPTMLPLPWHYVLGTRAEPPGGVDDGWKGRVFRGVWRALPLPVTRALGQRVARGLPL